MSLINYALKKAQKMQTQGQSPPPPTPGGAPGRPAGEDRPLSSQIFVLLALGVGALIALSVLATVYLLRKTATQVVVQMPAAAAVVAQAPAAAPVAPEKSVSSPVAPASPPTPPPAPPQNPAPNPTAPSEKPPLPPAPASAPVLTAAPTAPPDVQLPDLSLPQPAPSSSSGLDPTKPDPKILAYIDVLQVAGIRVSSTGNKVLMNDRVFREGELVDRLLGLHLKTITEDTLTFVDDRGVVYTKNL